MSIFEQILREYYRKEAENMTQIEKEVIKAALMNYETAIKDELTTQEHTAEEVQRAFDYWNTTTKLIAKFSK